MKPSPALSLLFALFLAGPSFAQSGATNDELDLLGFRNSAAERKIEITNKILGYIALTCLIIISLQGCLLLPLTILLYGWS